MIGLLLLCLGLAVGVYVAIVMWPQRIPKDRTVDAIRDRVENEAAHYRGGDGRGR